MEDLNFTALNYWFGGMYSAYLKERTPRYYDMPVMALVAYRRAKRVQESINFWSTRFNGTW